MIRLFTAIPVPDDLRARLSLMAAGIEGARWVPSENLHITLHFIGDVSEDRLEDIVAALDDVGASRLSITLDGAGFFGSRGRARAVWIGVRRTPELDALHDKTGRALQMSGLALRAVDTRPTSPLAV